MNPEALKKEHVRSLLETRFVNVYDLQYREGQHYYNATRHSVDALPALASREAYASLLPDAVSCFVVLLLQDGPRLLMTSEFRYTAGQFLLSIPAGLIDREDRSDPDAVIRTAKREIAEETGLIIDDRDHMAVVNPFAFSSPGMTDESNALVCAVLEHPDLSQLTQDGCVGGECFNGFCLATLDDAERFLRNGSDDNGMYYSMYTWAALLYFVTGRWRSLLPDPEPSEML